MYKFLIFARKIINTANSSSTTFDDGVPSHLLCPPDTRDESFIYNENFIFLTEVQIPVSVKGVSFSIVDCYPLDFENSMHESILVH